MTDRSKPRFTPFISTFGLALLSACVLQVDPGDETGATSAGPTSAGSTTDTTTDPATGSTTDAPTGDTTDAPTGSTAEPTTGSTTEPTTGGCEPVDPDDLGECVPYTPAVVEGMHAGVWLSGDDIVVLPIAVGDPGGGLVEVAVSAGDTPSTISVRRAGAPDTELHAGTTFGDLHPQETFIFRAHGDTDYELVVTPVVGPGGGDNSFEISWSYRPNIDCYEHNDTVADARRIPLGTDVSAFAHVGIIAGDEVLVGPSMVDFYRVELAVPTTVEFEVVKPSDEPIVFQLWDPVTETGVDFVDVLAVGGEPTLSGPLELAAGTHYIRVGHFVVDYSTLIFPEPIPAGWDHPYTLKVHDRSGACPD